MDQAWLVPVAIVLGFVLGAGSAAAVVAAHRRGRRAAAAITPVVPEGAEEVIDALPSAGIVLDASNNVLKASTSALAFGLVWNQALVHPELVALVDQVRRSGEPIARELHLSRGPIGAASIYLFVRVAALGSRFVLVLADDRTESHRLDEVRRDFVANVSHELKTPIGAIALLAEALEQAVDQPDEVARFAKRLTIESDRLSRLTHELIELSRLQAAEVPQKADLVDADDVISQAVDRTRVAAEKHGIALVTRGKRGAAVLGDEAMLVTAVQNLIANAIQFSPDNSRIGIGVGRAEGIVEISVTDQGVGIPEPERDRVFERFYRVDAARSRHTGGTGLGLSIVKHIVQNHGGEVRVWSQVGSGSTFTIRLPQATETRESAATAVSKGDA